MKKDIKALLGYPTTIVEKFHSKTKLKKFPVSKKQAEWPIEWKRIYYKEYPRLDKIVLTRPESIGKANLEDVLLSRETSRLFSTKSIPLEQISSLLYYTSGIISDGPDIGGNRPYPSAGARYPLEIYLVFQNGELPLGVYHYNLRAHSLEVLLRLKNFNATDYFKCEEDSIPPMFVIITAVFNRNMIKYGTRGYRHILAEVGHLAQNFYLCAAALNFAIGSLGGYIDDRINQELLDIDGLTESVVYVMGIGYKK